MYILAYIGLHGSLGMYEAAKCSRLSMDGDSNGASCVGFWAYWCLDRNSWGPGGIMVGD